MDHDGSAARIQRLAQVASAGAWRDKVPGPGHIKPRRESIFSRPLRIRSPPRNINRFNASALEQ